MLATSQTYLDKINEHRDLLRGRYGVRTIGIFGSAARGEETANSDVDVIVTFDAPIGFFTFLELENFLSRIIDRRVDLVTERALKPVIKARVLNDTIYA